jgi:hypothetical protein
MNLEPTQLLELARMALWAWIAALASFAAVGCFAFWRTSHGAAKSFTFLLTRGDTVRVLTVTGIVFAATFLALSRTIDGATVASVLSGIAGYVLGGITRSPSTESGATGNNEEGK